MKPIVLHVAAELSPFHKSGGLGDVLSGLPPALDGEGIDVRIITPRYGQASKFASIGGVEALTQWPEPLRISLAGVAHEVRVHEARTHRGLATTYFVEADHLSRGTLYGYGDDAYRFAIFGKATIAIASILARSRSVGRVAVLHAHDWHAALAVWYAKSLPSSIRGIPCVFTIHNLAFQGVERASTAPYLDIDWDAYHSIFEDDGTLNLMKGALMASDRITTVSPTYAREIRTGAYGHGLDPLLRWLSGKVRGIINGVDFTSWNPATDQHLPVNYDKGDVSGKEACKEALRWELGLHQPHDHLVPILGCVSRLTSQKGIDHLADVADDYIRRGGQIVVLGEGEQHLEQRLHWLQATHPGAFAFRRAFDEGLARRIYAGSDFFAMPSRFEPCGLAQMYSMRYGTVPIARATGGLVDTISPLMNQHDVGSANGILYASDDSSGFARAAQWGLSIARDHNAMTALKQNGMHADFSWERSARTYVEMYRELGL